MVDQVNLFTLRYRDHFDSLTHIHDRRRPVAFMSVADQSEMVFTAADPPFISRLYRHALESVFAFLGWGEIAITLRVSRSWLTTVKSMPGLQLLVEVNPPTIPICVIATSVVSRHISALGTVNKRLKLTVDTCFILTRHMPHLFELTCELSLPLGHELVTFPTKLRNLDLGFSATTSTVDINTMLRAIGCLTHLQHFHIRMNCLDHQISFDSLSQLPELQYLEITWSSANDFSDRQVDELRALSRLHTVIMAGETTNLLPRLLRQSHQLQWQTIAIPIVNDETVELLSHLPMLTKLMCKTSCLRFDWLSQLPNLICFSICFYQDTTMEGCMESLITGLHHCTQIEELELFCCDITSVQLAELLPGLPALTRLHLGSLDLTSLSFLAQVPMMRQLTTLILSRCKLLPLIEMKYVHRLRSLKKLYLRSSFASQMDAHGQFFYTPPSVVLPHLNEFEYTAP